MKCHDCGGTGQEVHPMNANETCDECGTPVLVNMNFIQTVQRETHNWRISKWPDLNPMAQAFGTAIEIMELGELIFKAQYYDEEWADEDRLKEEAGDALIYLLGVMSLLDLDVVECIEAAQDKNYSRDWDSHQEAPSND